MARTHYMAPMTKTSLTATDRHISRWLFFVMSLVVAMIAIGGATRLTNSGLSITEWKPITGALPPLSAEQWQIEFEKYKQIPEFLAEHPDMDVESFKFIYFWEWGHRQLGRVIGLAFALPFFLVAVPTPAAGRANMAFLDHPDPDRGARRRGLVDGGKRSGQ